MVAAWTYFALSGPPDAGFRGFGYDIDGLCTCPDRPSCRNALDGAPNCDEPGTGRDNQLGSLVSLLIQYGALDEKGLNDDLANGRYGVILRIDHYNGLANDSRVSVALYDAVSVGDGGPPRNDGLDEWTVDQNSTQGAGVVPFFVDQEGYVAGGVLVASLPRFELRAMTAPEHVTMPFEMTDVHLTAELRVGGGQVDIDQGLLAGRMSLASLQEIANIRGLCNNDEQIAKLAVTACQLADIAVDPTHDKTGDLACDGYSTAIFFKAVHSKIAKTPVTREAGVGRCDGGAPVVCR
jgi:hypothetical protein